MCASHEHDEKGIFADFQFFIIVFDHACRKRKGNEYWYNITVKIELKSYKIHEAIFMV